MATDQGLVKTIREDGYRMKLRPGFRLPPFASDLLQLHIQILVDDYPQWQTISWWFTHLPPAILEDRLLVLVSHRVRW
jgi:hypothetical protein